MILAIITAFHVYAGATERMSEILQDAVPVLNGEVVVQESADDQVNDEDNIQLMNISNYDHEDINSKIWKIKHSNLSDRQKVYRVAKILADHVDELDIKYKSGSKIFGTDEDWEELNDDLISQGIFYHDGLELDCSGFVQYVYYISTGKKVGPSTIYQVENSNEINRIPGAIGYTFRPGEGDADNHCAIWLGHNLYIDCSDSSRGVRLKDITDNEFWEGFMVYFATLNNWDKYNIEEED